MIVVERPGRGRHGERRAERGAPGTTSRLRSSTISAPTTAFRTGFTARSRTPAPWPSPAAAAYLGINSHSWRPIDVGGESEYIAPDPLNPEILYGGIGRHGSRAFNLRTDQDQDISPILAHPGVFRYTWTLPLVILAADPHALYFGNQVIFRTHQRRANAGGLISPDLTRSNPGIPPNLDRGDGGRRRPADNRRGVVYTIAPSPLAARTIWAGTDDGLIQLTRDGGKTWHNVTPPRADAWSKISMIDGFALRRRHGLCRRRPASAGRSTALHLPNARRRQDLAEDHQRHSRRGLCAGRARRSRAARACCTPARRRGVYVSFDDGNHWQSLQLNLPHTSMRDLAFTGRRPGGRHLRPLVLGPRRPYAAAAAEGDGGLGPGAPVPARGRAPRPAGRRRRHAVHQGDPDRAEPAPGGHSRLHAAVAALVASDAGDPGFGPARSCAGSRARTSPPR